MLPNRGRRRENWISNGPESVFVQEIDTKLDLMVGVIVNRDYFIKYARIPDVVHTHYTLFRKHIALTLQINICPISVQFLSCHRISVNNSTVQGILLCVLICKTHVVKITSEITIK